MFAAYIEEADTRDAWTAELWAGSFKLMTWMFRASCKITANGAEKVKKIILKYVVVGVVHHQQQQRRQCISQMCIPTAKWCVYNVIINHAIKSNHTHILKIPKSNAIIIILERRPQKKDAGFLFVLHSHFNACKEFPFLVSLMRGRGAVHFAFSSWFWPISRHSEYGWCWTEMSHEIAFARLFAIDGLKAYSTQLSVSSWEMAETYPWREWSKRCDAGEREHVSVRAKLTYRPKIDCYGWASTTMTTELLRAH